MPPAISEMMKNICDGPVLWCLRPKISSLVWEASETVARYTGSPHAAVPKISTAGAAMRGSTWVLKQNNQFDQ
jgi:hypothetical protein